MNIDKFGAVFVSAEEMFDSIYSGKIKTFDNIYLDKTTVNQFNSAKNTNRDKFDSFKEQDPNDISLEKFDTNLQNNWFMPEKYKSFDIKGWCLDCCTTPTQIARVNEELELFAQYDMIDLLCYLKYLVDTMREHNIVWGVGRGSSVASYCLYLLGVHKIDSIKYDLDIREFLK